MYPNVSHVYSASAEANKTFSEVKIICQFII